MLVKIKYFYTVLFLLFCLCQSKKCIIKKKQNNVEKSDIERYIENNDITVDLNDIEDNKITDYEIETPEATENIENTSTFKPVTVTSKYSMDETYSSILTIDSDITSLDPSTTSESIISTEIPTSTINSDIISPDTTTVLESIISNHEIISNPTTTNSVTSDILPTNTSNIQDNNNNSGLSYFVVSFNVTFSEKHEKQLDALKTKYPQYFTIEKYKETKCDENCLLLELALIELSNEIRDIIANNTNMMNKAQLKDFKEYDRKGRFNNLPLEHSILYNQLATVTNRYNEKGEIIYIKANDNIMEIIKNYYKSKITSIEKHVYPSTTSSFITNTPTISVTNTDEDDEEMEIPISWSLDL